MGCAVTPGQEWERINVSTKSLRDVYTASRRSPGWLPRRRRRAGKLVEALARRLAPVVRCSGRAVRWAWRSAEGGPYGNDFWTE